MALAPRLFFDFRGICVMKYYPCPLAVMMKKLLGRTVDFELTTFPIFLPSSFLLHLFRLLIDLPTFFKNSNFKPVFLHCARVPKTQRKLNNG